MDLNEITPLVLTYNEEANIGMCLKRLQWARRVVVLDSFSTDNTITLAQGFPNVVIKNRKFDNHTTQWNYGLDQIDSEWVLALDADYILPLESIVELQLLHGNLDAYSVFFNYCVFGKRLRASLYPPRTSLFRVKLFRYAQDGHTQLLNTASAIVGGLSTRIDHDDRKSLARWFSSQMKYAALESQKLSTPTEEVHWKDSIRQWFILAPILTPLYCLLYKRLVFDGWPGLYYTLQRTFAELVLSLTLLDKKIRSMQSKDIY